VPKLSLSNTHCSGSSVGTLAPAAAIVSLTRLCREQRRRKPPYQLSIEVK